MEKCKKTIHHTEAKNVRLEQSKKTERKNVENNECAQRGKKNTFAIHIRARKKSRKLGFSALSTLRIVLRIIVRRS